MKNNTIHRTAEEVLPVERSPSMVGTSNNLLVRLAHEDSNHSMIKAISTISMVTRSHLARAQQTPPTHLDVRTPIKVHPDLDHQILDSQPQIETILFLFDLV